MLPCSDHIHQLKKAWLNFNKHIIATNELSMFVHNRSLQVDDLFNDFWILYTCNIQESTTNILSV